ncbi:hypothetical protein REJC140_00105 [Pseudorhizobium endolithicum]|uniref:Uncharacterized protein n=1 Tax=Pseudorhizobium endolithicum TaxID=1191678 RepID=A0ABM8PCK7_9HYPH|nr:hypothetical protein [Pseudorhizobium endolithicum]CAD7023136.1 hypothetical protein REJC140_00105 [Pseudorhizobium endolithicum]
MAVFDLPFDEVVECTFTLMEGTVSSGFNRGMAFNISQVTDPIWKVAIETAPLDREDRQKWHAWKLSLKGGLNRFRCFDIGQMAPLAYEGAQTPQAIASGWAGSATVASLGTSGALTLGGVPAGYMASAGDRVELSQGAATALYEIIAPATATSGGALALTVAPLLHTSTFTAAAVARLWRPRALFIMDHTSWSHQVVANPTPATFEGYQVLR